LARRVGHPHADDEHRGEGPVKPPRPRVLVHRGSIEAAGVLVEPALVGEAEARRRVLSLWNAGTRVRAAGDALAVVWLERRRLRAEDAAGAPLVPCGRALAAVPLVARDVEAIAPAPDTLIVVRGGELHAEPLGQEVDPTAWIDVSGVVHERAS